MPLKFLAHFLHAYHSALQFPSLLVFFSTLNHEPSRGRMCSMSWYPYAPMRCLPWKCSARQAPMICFHKTQAGTTAVCGRFTPRNTSLVFAANSNFTASVLPLPLVPQSCCFNSFKWSILLWCKQMGSMCCLLLTSPQQ